MLKLHSHSALHEPLFRRYFVAACQAALGTWVVRFLLGWLAWDLTHSALWVGAVSACMLLPSIILSPLFGVLSDRISPRNGMLGTLSAQAVVALLTAAVMAAGWFSLPWLVALTLAAGAISAAHHPLRLALIPQLVSRRSLASAIGLSAIMFNLSRIVGPAIAGVFIAQFSSAAAFLLAALLFAGAFIALLRVHAADRARSTDNASVMAQLVEGLRFAANNAPVRLTLLFTCVNGLLGRAVLELLPAISGQLLSGDAGMLAVLMAVAGVGSILGGALLARQNDNEGTLTRLVLFSLAGSTLVLLLVRWATTPWLLAPIVAYLSFATTMVGVGSQALAQLAVQEEFRGRVMSLWIMLSMGAPAIGGFALGAIADRIGFGATLIGAVPFALLLVGYLWRQVRREAQPA